MRNGLTDGKLSTGPTCGDECDDMHNDNVELFGQ